MPRCQIRSQNIRKNRNIKMQPRRDSCIHIFLCIFRFISESFVYIYLLFRDLKITVFPPSCMQMSVFLSVRLSLSIIYMSVFLSLCLCHKYCVLIKIRNFVPVSGSSVNSSGKKHKNIENNKQMFINHYYLTVRFLIISCMEERKLVIIQPPTP